MTGFDALGVPPVIRAALDAMGYHEPTPVQEQGIPAILAGGDILLEAQTGSGKTAAFGVPAVAAGSRGAGLRVLVLVPTRELARQVAEEIRAIGSGSPFRAVAVTGGVGAEKEERTLGGDVRCVVATPGRLLALLEERKVRFDRLELLVLDEADRMLDMGFRAEIERVLEAATARKQTVLVSATLPRAVVALAERHLREPREVRAGARRLPAGLSHFRLNVFADQKERALVALLGREKPERAIVFVRTRARAAAYAKLLKQADFAADALQGDMSHEQRRHVFDLFARGTTRILVATDIASRGLDVPEMELVVNVDLPDEPGAYTHRAGRAARLNRPGKVVTMVQPSEKADRLRLEGESGAEWPPYPLSSADVQAARLPSDEPPAPPPAKKGARKPPAKGPAAKAASGKKVPPKPARPPPQRAPLQRPPRAVRKAEEKAQRPRPAPQKREEPDVPPSRRGRERPR